MTNASLKKIADDAQFLTIYEQLDVIKLKLLIMSICFYKFYDYFKILS